MYEYEKTCLTEMIRYNIISIKDHAKDIADELIEILDQITVQTIEDQSVVVFPDNFIKTQLVLAMSHGITLTLCKDDFMILADKVINELFHIKTFTD